ncbi:MAG: TIGR03761 family integrating conjugative element protein [Gammaproteobacteria bacterium]|nr:TIGR03761 family integrating conjugative element protein [Gammaproteobacteria bacterium]
MSSGKSEPDQRAEQHPEDARVDAGPGALRGQVWLTVQTRQAQRLIRGRNGNADKPAIIGLVGFADRLRVIWQAARNDDPYADWWLVKVHEALERVHDLVKNEQAALDAQLEQLTALEVAVAESMKPFRIALQFANPYAYRGAQLIAEYDRFVRTLLTAHHVGLLTGATMEGSLNTCARKIRGAFAVPQGYHFLNVDRATLQQGTANASRARQVMGEVPDGVLNGAHQAPLAPRKVRFPEEAAKHIRLSPVDSAPKADIAAAVNDVTGST